MMSASSSTTNTTTTTRRKKPSLLQTLVKPGWESAEVVIPILHKCLAALLAVLLYTAQHNEGSLRVHLLAMSALTVGLWGSVTWFVIEYRSALAKSRQGNGEEGGERTEGTAAAAPGTAAPIVTAPAPGNKPIRYTD